MPDKSKDIRLVDFVDIELLQKFQDAFSKMTGIASVTLDDNGPVTNPSNFTDFCSKYTRQSKEGSARCTACDMQWGRVAAAKGEPVVYECHTGLTDFAVPIMLQGKHIASIFGGQILTHAPNEEHFRNIAIELGINEDEYIEAVRKIRIVTREQIEDAAQMLFFVANAISQIAHKKYILMEKRKRDEIYKKLVETIRSSLKIDETLKIIAKEIGKIFEIERVAIGEFPNKDNLKDFYLVEEYKKDETINSPQKNKTYKQVVVFMAKTIMETNKPFIVNNTEEADIPEFVKDTLKETDVKSIVMIPIMLNNELWGFMTLSKFSDYKIWSDEELLLLDAITAQLYMAIKHAQFYKQEKQAASREALLRETISIIRSSLDVEEIKNVFVEMVCKYFNADRCLFVDFDKEEGKFLPFRIEKLSDPTITSLVGIDLEKDFAEFCAKLKKGKDIIIKDLEKTLLKKNLPHYKSLKTLQNSGTKSDYGLYIKYVNNIMGIIVMHFVKEKRVLTSEELQFLKVIRDQVGVALYQAETYLQLKQQAQKEYILRDIINKIRSSLDIEKIKNEIVNQIGKFFQADRVAVAYYDYAAQNYIITKEGEYRSSDEVKTFIGVDFVNTPGFAEYIRNIHFKGEDIIFNDLEKYLDENNLRNTGVETFYREFGFTSSAAINMSYEDVFLGNLVITFQNRKDFSKDELEFLRTLASQIGVAFHQSELYDKEKQSAQREKNLRQIMLATAGSFNFEDVINSIVTAAGKMLKADRCFYVEYDLPNETVFPIKDYAEYRSSENIRSHTTRVPSTEEVSEFVKMAINKQTRIVEDIEKIDLPTPARKMLVDDLGVKAYAIFPVYYGNILYGSIVFHYVNNLMHLTEEEIDTAKSLAYQSAIVINQVKLYEKIQKTAEREKLLRKIIELTRSSLDLNEVKQKVTQELGKAFKADRCYFRSYYRDKDICSKAQAEYLANDEITSLSDVEPDNEAFRVYVRAIDERKRAFYPLIVDENLAKGTPIEKYMKDVGIKVDYAIPIVDRQEELSWLLLHYVKNDPKLEEEDNNLLETIAYQIDIAFEQIKLYNTVKQNAEREAILRTITGTIRSSLDMNATKQTIVDIVGKTLKADRCFIMEYDKKQGKFKNIENEYLSSENVSSYASVDINISVPNFAEGLKEGKSLMVKDRQIFIGGQLQDYDIERQVQKKFDVNSAYGFPIFYNKDLLGVLGIHYITDEHKVSEDEYGLIGALAEQIAVALHQSKLYNTIIQVTTNQNAILNNLPFMAWLKDKESRMLAVNNAFAKMVGKTIKNIVGKTDYDFFPRGLADLYVKEDTKVMEIKETISSVDLIASSEDATERWHETYKSPVLDDKQNATGTVGLSRDVTEEKEAHLELIRRQKEIIKASEREMLIGSLVSRAISTFDINQIKQIVKDIGIISKADRCYFVEADTDQTRGIPIDYEGEYLASNDITSIIGYEFKAEDVENFVSLYLEKKDLIVFDFDEIREENAPLYQGIIRYADAANLKISIGIPFFSGDRLRAVLAVEYVKEKIIPSAEELDFLRIVGNQIGMVFNQIKLYDDTKKTAEREMILRKIIEGIRSSLDINTIKNTIVNEIGKVFNADRCILLTRGFENNTLSIDEFSEYKTENVENSFINLNIEAPEVSWFVNAFKNNREFCYSNVEDFLEQNNLKGTLEEKFLRENSIQSTYNVPISYSDKVFGFVVLEYISKQHKLEDVDMIFLRTIAAQAGIAFNQAESFKRTKIQAEKESLLRRIFEDIRSSLDINSIKTNIVQGTGKALGADICFIMDYEAEEDNFVIHEYSEYRSSDKEKSFVNFDTQDAKVKRFVDSFRQRQELIIGNMDEYIVQNNLQGTLEEEFLRDYGIKSSYNTPIIYSEHLFGYLVIEYTNNYRDYDSDNLAFIRTIANQAGIALHQADLYKQTQMQAEREAFIRNIIETVGESLSLETVLNAICKEVFELFKPDRVAIENYPDLSDYKKWSVNAQYKSGEDILSVQDIDYPAESKEYLGIRLLEEGRDIMADDLGKSDLPDYFIKTHKQMHVKSLMAIPLKSGDKKWGVLVLSQVHKYRKWTQKELQLLHTVANQSSIAIRQAELYSQVKTQAEREKFGRNIIEILRSTIDKNTIKNLFVRYIGKFFNANRVVFSEYDEKNKIYLPIDRQSEYLSSPKEKSFVGFDWTNEEAADFIQPLLEKRELIIPCWPEYINQNYKSQEFISLFEEAGVKSSYNFPVLYQERIIGFFCIEFTKEDCVKLDEGDINMIRNICLQAGIALFHAQLYIHAKESSMSKENFIANMSQEIQVALNKIIENTTKLSKAEEDKEIQKKYLQSLSKDSKGMIELKENITSMSEIESENFKFNYEQIDTEKLIMDLISPLKHLADEGNISIETDLEKGEINADKKRLIKAMYNILVTTISLTPSGGHINVKSELKDNKFYVSVRDWGEGQGFYTMNVIFETLKQLDSNFIMRQKDVRLGLSVAKKIIELHGGYIHVDSMEDNGTNVWFVVPCSK